jgi:hypothetical protein
MAKIGLIAVDGQHFPNLALMKFAAYHKAAGDGVGWVNFFERYDKVYMSKVFTFTPDVTTFVRADEVVKGGTGYNMFTTLPVAIEKTPPDYSIYPHIVHAYGFLTRGCVRRCKWCVVPQKEGAIQAAGDIEEILQGGKSAILMDNNILASEYGLRQLEKIAKIGCRVDFNQGLDARLVSEAVAAILARIKWIKYIRFAFDTPEQFAPLLRAITLLNRSGVASSRIFVYVLLRELLDSCERIRTCKAMGVTPFAQPYRDFTANQIIPQWQKDMARWCNRKELLKSIDFNEFMPRNGFRCKKYFENLQ